MATYKDHEVWCVTKLKLVDVDKITSAKKRTDLIKKTLKEFGYKMSMEEFKHLVATKSLPEKQAESLIKYLGERRIASTMSVNEELIIGYSVMRLGSTCGFYISRNKKRPDSPPEVRLIIENEEEFEVVWLDRFIECLNKSIMGYVDTSEKLEFILEEDEG